MPDIQITTIGTEELTTLFREKPVEAYRSAADRMADLGLEDAPTVSRVLEFYSPSEPGDNLDAFGRLMRAEGIITRSDPAMGIYASPAEKFLSRGRVGRMLLTEFAARQWRRVAYNAHDKAAQDRARAIFLSDDGVQGSWERPWSDAASARWDQTLRPAISLSELIAMTTPIASGDYRSYYLTYDAEALRMFRVGESADIPIADLAKSEQTIELKKYARGLRASYEQLRRIRRVDKLALMIQRMAIQAEIDKVNAAIDILVNGDGNAATVPTTVNLTTLDTAATAGTLTLKGWLSYKMQFTNEYIVTTGLMQEAVLLQLLLLNIGSGNVPLVQLPSMLGSNLTVINQTADGVRVGHTSQAPALKVVGVDRRLAMEHVVEIGSEISEMDRFVENQTEVLTMSEVSGFAIMDGNATIILDVNA